MHTRDAERTTPQRRPHSSPWRSAISLPLCLSFLSTFQRDHALVAVGRRSHMKLAWQFLQAREVPPLKSSRIWLHIYNLGCVCDWWMMVSWPGVVEASCTAANRIAKCQAWVRFRDPRRGQSEQISRNSKDSSPFSYLFLGVLMWFRILFCRSGEPLGSSVRGRAGYRPGLLANPCADFLDAHQSVSLVLNNCQLETLFFEGWIAIWVAFLP